MSLQSRVERITGQTIAPDNRDEAFEIFQEVLDGLNTGVIRSASRNSHGVWEAHAWVKQGILLGFKLGELTELTGGGWPFFDKDTYPIKPLTLEDRVRIVPGGSAIRTGAYIAPGVVCMPPMYVNVGAYVDEGTMIDSHALVGSCAQIGKNVHLSAAAQIGGVLEPVGAVPVVVEDDVFVGGGCGIYEGCILRKSAVLAPGVILTGSTRVYDVVYDRILERSAGASLEIPEGAVLVPGSRSLQGAFAAEYGLALYAPVIVKYRDGKTNASVTLESVLR